MEKKKNKKVINLLICALVIVEVIIIIGMVTFGSGASESIINGTNVVWVDFNVTGTISVLVPDTNCGEVPDEAWEEARRLLSKCDDLKDIKFETVGHTLIESGNNLNKTTQTDANTYIVIVSGIIKGDNTEEAKEHFWENICSEVWGKWCISEIDL